jgi:flagella basal body P-ring formation protein FlgA
MGRALPILCLAALVLAPGRPGATEARQAVALRQHVVMHEQVVTLGHLFANLPQGLETKAVGPAPLPGQRWILEARQLSLIARDNSLAWRPASPHERLVLERLGRRISREAVEDALAAELGALGLPAGLEPELAQFNPPVIAELSGEPRLLFDRPAVDLATRRFFASMVIVAPGSPPLRQDLTGRLVAMRSVAVPSRALRTEEVIGPEDVVLRRVATDRIPNGAVTEPALLIGARPRRPLAADVPLVMGDVVPNVVIRKDSVLSLRLQVGGLTVTAEARALEDAVAGAIVQVVNLSNGRILRAQAIGPGEARPLGPAAAEPPARRPERAAQLTTSTMGRP